MEYTTEFLERVKDKVLKEEQVGALSLHCTFEWHY